MTAFTVLVLALAAQDAPPPVSSPEAPSKAVKLVVLDAKIANPEDVDAVAAKELTSFVAARASRFAVEVVALSALHEVLALDANKEVAGCDTSTSSCLADLSRALGADLLLVTRAGKLDAVYVVSLQLYDARSGGASGGAVSASVEAWSMAEASTKAGPAIDGLLRNATGAEPVEAVAAVAQAEAPPVTIDDNLRFGLQVGGGAGAALGAVLIGLGSVPALQYGAKKDELGQLTRSFTGTPEQVAQATLLHREALEAKAAYNDLGRWSVLGGGALVVLGGAALAAGFLLPSPTAPTEGGTP